MSTNTILGLFAKSPLSPLREHSNTVYECCSVLVTFFEVAFNAQWEEASQLRSELLLKERQAAVLKREIRLKLHRGLFLPVDRIDMLALVHHQDRLASIAKDISGRIIGRHLQIPHAVHLPFMGYVQRCLDAVQQSKRVINELDVLLETGFRGRVVALVGSMVLELDNIEDDTDQLQIVLRRALMELEAQCNPIDIMFLYQILEWIGSLADQAVKVSACLEMMLAHT